MPVQVSEADKDRYSAFVKGQLARFLRPAPDTLWHYTSGVSLISIIESGTLWATQVSCMNDHTEFEYAVGLLSAAFREKRNAAQPSADDVYLYDRVEAGLAEGGAATSEWFVACLSERPDDLGQWRAYGGGEGGYAIGFESASIVKCGLPDHRLLLPVSYDREKHMTLCRALVDATLQFFLDGLAAHGGSAAEWADAFLAEWREMVVYLAPMLKDEAFEVENEWRIVRRLRPDDIEKMKYRRRRRCYRVISR
jgi:hypothetical protein